jgi:large subunit ribosomal protein L28
LTEKNTHSKKARKCEELMSRKCELTGKRAMSGNNVSHAKNRTKRRFKPNLQNITFVSEALGQKFQLKVAVSTIRTVEKKGGLDEFLINTPNSKLPLKAKKLKKTILSKSN